MACHLETGVEWGYNPTLKWTAGGGGPDHKSRIADYKLQISNLKFQISKGNTKMNRRKFLTNSAKVTLVFDLLHLRPALASAAAGSGAGQAATVTSASEAVLPGTTPLTMQGDLAKQMVDGIHQFLMRRLEETPQERERLWQRDYGSVERYQQSVLPNRERFRQIIGAVDPRVTPQPPELLRSPLASPHIAQGSGYKVFPVRWSVFDPIVPGLGGMHAEGLLLQPEGRVTARVVAIPDADWTPEMLVGLASGVPEAAQFARRLAENGGQVLVPMLINRDDTFSGLPGFAMTNEPHREWIYRMAFEVGRHIIGYEVQKVLAAVDWFASEQGSDAAPIGVMGYGEGGLIALYSAAVDPRIQATVVSGYFEERESAWKEPIYRDVWGLVREFGDTEVASLIAPRTLIVEACRGPEVVGPQPVTKEHKNAACPNGRLTTPPLDSVQREVERARRIFTALSAGERLQLVVSDGGQGQPGSEAALGALLRSLGGRGQLRRLGNAPRDLREGFDPQARLKSQLDDMVEFTQAIVQKSPDTRAEFWSKADSSSAERWKETTQFYRDHIWEEVIGRLPAPSLPANPRTRLVYEEPKFKGYEVVLDVWPDVFAYGTLLIPKDMRPGERRPAVVCQHGVEGRTQDVADPKIDSHFYHHFGASLANEGFVTYAPQDPYRGLDNFRIIQRMAHPLKLALYSFVLGLHQQTFEWLAAQPFIDPERIGFYGLSYGGRSAVRVPPLLGRHALSICSADFSAGVWKTTNPNSRYSFLLAHDYDVYEFNFANVVNYSDLASLMAPRPFMVERGHSDPVAPDEWVAFEYAKVERFYDKLGIPERTTIEYFDGGHTIHGVGTFEFLRQHLNFPKT
jgi:dienelactone hydrolase